MRQLKTIFCVLWLLPCFGTTADAAPDFAAWGEETLTAIHRDMWLPEKGLYAEHATGDDRPAAAPAFMWGVGVELSALVAASKVTPEKYLPQAVAYADAIQVYWHEHSGIAGFDVLPGPKSADRYYDDNAWLVLALADLHEISGEKRFLERAAATFRFVVSCEDDKLGGGLYWQENELRSKNTCTNAPAIVGALRLHQLTKEASYLATAQRLYEWTNAQLRDTSDGLFWDNIRLDGRIDRRKFSYNSALMIRANCLFHAITGEARFLDEARKMADAATAHWVREDGAVADSGRFAHMLMESLLAVGRADCDPKRAETVTRTLVYVHANLRDDHGRYPHRWDRPARGSLRESALLNQAGVARAFWMAAGAADDQCRTGK